MSNVAGEIINFNFKCGHRDRIEVEMRVLIGAAGAVGSPLQFQDDPSMTVVHGSTGVYALTFPPSADTNGQLDTTVISAAGTVRGAFTTAFAPNSGTASITVVNAAGSPTDPANGDVLCIALTLSRCV